MIMSVWIISGRRAFGKTDLDPCEGLCGDFRRIFMLRRTATGYRRRNLR